MSSLVIVESPTKAKTISRFLPSSKYKVMASLGHVRDLPRNAKEIPARYKKEPWSTLSVQIENGEFKPLYIIPPDKRKVVKELKNALSSSEELLIATDEDREGEAIGWHLLEVLKPKVPVRRMVFHEITKQAIQKALSNTRAINHDLVESQESRRVLDRLVGYRISPVLWRKIGKGTSAGRVQSVAVRLLVEREKKRMEFIPANYWDIEATLQSETNHFKATMTHLGEQRLANGRDFDDQTGELKASPAKSKLLLLKEREATELVKQLPLAEWRVAEVTAKDRRRTPAAPFITSSLQQEGNRKFGWGARKTMMVAQKLYEHGFITYMRTDSVTLSQEALTAARDAVVRTYGEENLSKQVRRYKSKVANAQEAHEAIRPAGQAMRTGSQLGLKDADQQRLYDLIWKRTVASQMADAKLRDIRVISAATVEGGPPAYFRSTGRQILFPGFLLVYVEGSDNPEKGKENTEKFLPDLKAGQPLQCRNLESKSHETKPPARYTEPSLISTLEKEGIGRPSTYATIISTIQDRGSAIKSGKALAPTFRAFATNAFMQERFDSLVDTGFTAKMEERLDEIAQGKAKRQEFLYAIDQGREGIQNRVERAIEQVDARTISTITSPKWKKCTVRVGRYGPYVEANLGGVQVRSTVPEEWLPADVDEDRLLTLLKTAKTPATELGVHPDSGQPILIKEGKYGHYIELAEPEGSKEKPRRKSIPKNLQPADVNLSLAVEMLKFPVELGLDSKTGERVFFDKGPYGPYVKRGRVNATIGKDRDLSDITLNEAIQLLDRKAASPPRKGRGRKKRK